MLTPTARRNLSELASRRFKLRLRPSDAPVVATWCGALGSCQKVPSWFVVNSFALCLPGADDRRAGTREAREDDAFSARARGSEPSRSRLRLRRARFLGPRPRARQSEQHGETEIKVARVDASSFATGAREAAARMSANGATTGEGDVRTLWIGDLVRIPSTRLPRRRPRTRPRAAHRSRPLSHARPQSRRRRDDISRCRLDALGSRRARLSTRARALITIGSNAVARRRASPRKPARAHPPSHASEPTTGLLGRGAVLAVVFRAFRCVRVVFSETHRL